MASWQHEEYRTLMESAQHKLLKEEIRLLRKKSVLPKDETNHILGLAQLKMTALIKSGKFGNSEYCDILHKAYDRALPGYYADDEMNAIFEKFEKFQNSCEWLIEDMIEA